MSPPTTSIQITRTGSMEKMLILIIFQFFDYWSCNIFNNVPSEGPKPFLLNFLSVCDIFYLIILFSKKNSLYCNENTIGISVRRVTKFPKLPQTIHTKIGDEYSCGPVYITVDQFSDSNATHFNENKRICTYNGWFFWV